MKRERGSAGARQTQVLFSFLPLTCSVTLSKLLLFSYFFLGQGLPVILCSYSGWHEKP